MGFLTQALFWTAGSGWIAGGIKAQCCWYSAPCSIHWMSSFFSASVRLKLDLGEGMTSSGSVVRMRLTNSLSWGLKGTMARLPDSNRAVAFSKEVSWRPASTLFSSGPWHLKQRSAKMGLIWLLKSSLGSAGMFVTNISSLRATHVSSLRDSPFATIFPRNGSPARGAIWVENNSKMTKPDTILRWFMLKRYR